MDHNGIYIYTYIYMYTCIYIYTHVRSQLCPWLWGSRPWTSRISAIFANATRTMNGRLGWGFFWWMAVFPMGFVGFFPWDFVDWLPCLVWYRFFFRKKNPRAKMRGWNIFLEKWVKKAVWISNTNQQSFKKLYWKIGDWIKLNSTLRHLS